MALITFRLPYHTRWGEAIELRYTTSDGQQGRLALETTDGHTWTGQLKTTPKAYWLRYDYALTADGHTVREEQDALRQLHLPEEREQLHVLDSWTEAGIAPVFRHSAFTECVFGARFGIVREDFGTTGATLTLAALPAPEGWRWGVAGSCPSLGGWDTTKAVPLQRTGTYAWSCQLDEADIRQGFDYKFVLIDGKEPHRLRWEEGANRHLSPTPPANMNGHERTTVFASSPRLALPCWRGAGVVIPVFALRSQGSWGVGDFGDLRMLTDWAASVQMSAIQILPINDTTFHGTWRDSYPYSSMSVFALHPIYLDPREWSDTPAFRRYVSQAEKLNDLPQMDYEAVLRLKLLLLDDIYRTEGRRTLSTGAFRQFAEENAYWLQPYARFYAGKGTSVRTAGYYRFVQFVLHRQLSAAHNHARQRGIILKGDIPIGVSRDSIPAKELPRLFHLDKQAGAPPDDFAREGQNWGFPTYNWEEMAKDGYQWWRQRLSHMARYFDAYRIDHVLGFFRIWEIPQHAPSALLGHFRPALPLSPAEIREAGFTLPIDFYVRPHITEQQRASLPPALRNRLRREGGYYTLRNGSNGPIPETLTAEQKNMLRAIMTDVLFIEDEERPGKYHPRVCGRLTQAYANLPADQQAAFDRLHDDFFYVRHNAFWAHEAMKKLPPVTNYAEADGGLSMLPCAEDLGMIPASAKGILQRLQVLSLEIQSMPKAFGRRFAELEQNPYLSVATIATHDMPPLRLWWRQDAERTQQFWNEVLHREGKAPADAPAEACGEVVRQHLASPSMLCLLALQDWLSTDESLRHPAPEEEQINVPAEADHYWRYRMHLFLEDLFGATNFNERLRAAISQSGRGTLPA